MEPYLRNGKNVTTDNFFTSLELVNELKKKQTSIVGTADKARRELPPPAKSIQQLYSSKLFKNGDCEALTAYQCKPETNVYILSSVHCQRVFLQRFLRKPETVFYYNQTKCSVDSADQVARLYSVKAGTRRWPVVVFNNILDLACSNAFVLYKMRTNEKISRRDFIFKLATELRQAYMNSKMPRAPQAHH